MNKAYYTRQALRKLGLRADEFSIDSDETRDALCELESMMLNWDGRGLRFGYALAADPENVNPNEDANIPDYVGDAVIYQLAMRLAADYGKSINPSLAQQAQASMNTLYMNLDIPVNQYPRTMPIGSGNQRRFNRFQRYFRQAGEILIDNALALETNVGKALTIEKPDTTLAEGGTPTPTSPGAPDAPVLSGELDGDDVDLSWTTIPGATGYRLYRDAQAIFTSITPSGVEYTDNPGSGVFIYTVTAFNQYGESEQSNSVQISNVEFVTFDPAQVGSDVILTNNNLSVAVTQPNQVVTTTAARSSGKYYWEIRMDTIGLGAANSYFGFYDPLQAPTTRVGNSVRSWALYGFNRSLISGGVFGASKGSGVVSTTIVSVALDLDNGLAWFGVDGAWLDSGDPSNGTNPSFPNTDATSHDTPITGSEIIPAISISNTGDTLTANFGQDSFVYSVPSGFSEGFFE